MNKGSLPRILTVLAGIIVVVLGMIWIGNVQDHANDPETLSVEVNNQDWFEGGTNAKVTLVEYSDFQCPACGAYYPVLQDLHTAFGDNLKIVYRNYPLTQLHQNAQLAAQAAEAAGLQGNFFGMHDMLFEGQDEWSNLADPTETFAAYALALGLDEQTFRADLVSSAVKNAVAEDVRSGDGAHVSGTPTFFLNGVQITNPRGYQPFVDVINAALQAESEESADPTLTTK